MSRIGKKPIAIPANTEVTISEGVVTVKGPLGQLTRKLNKFVEVKVEDGNAIVSPIGKTLDAKAFWGTFASHIQNMVDGVNKEFEKKLTIEGVGFKAAIQGDKLVLSLGFSHPVELKIPDGITCELEKLDLTIKGIDKEAVGQFAAVVRSKKKPEPYKGKGIRYFDEIIRRKEGKKSV